MGTRSRAYELNHECVSMSSSFSLFSIPTSCFFSLICFNVSLCFKGMVVGAGTEAIAAEGMIVTAGALDGHVHFICPQLAREAIASGITTLFGGGTGPATGTNATTCTPGPNHIR